MLVRITTLFIRILVFKRRSYDIYIYIVYIHIVYNDKIRETMVTVIITDIDYNGADKDETKKIHGKREKASENENERKKRERQMKMHVCE